jgi:hypothetical protein
MRCAWRLLSFGRPAQLSYSLSVCPAQGGMLYLAPAVKEKHEVTVTFQLPSLQSHYRKKADEYLSHLIGHEGKGSLLSALKVCGARHSKHSTSPARDLLHWSSPRPCSTASPLHSGSRTASECTRAGRSAGCSGCTLAYHPCLLSGACMLLGATSLR